MQEAKSTRNGRSWKRTKKQLEVREYVLNLVPHNAYLDDDTAHLARVMSADKLMIGKF